MAKYVHKSGGGSPSMPGYRPKKKRPYKRALSRRRYDRAPDRMPRNPGSWDGGYRAWRKA